MSPRLVGVELPPGAETDPARPELEALVARLHASIGLVLASLSRSTPRHPMAIVAGRRVDFGRAHVAPPKGVGAWCVLAVPCATVAEGWLRAGRLVDARDLLEARSDAGEVPLVLVLADGTVSLSRAVLRTGDLA